MHINFRVKNSWKNPKRKKRKKILPFWGVLTGGGVRELRGKIFSIK